MERLNIGIDAARKKIQHYCAYQERCHSETKSRLYEMGLRSAEVDQLLAELVQENFLSEERFAYAFAGGKFRMKHWGRVKIKYELKKRLVSEYCIRKGLTGIDEDEYMEVLKQEAGKRARSLAGNISRKRSTLTRYLLQKGFEQNLVNDVVKERFP